MAHGGVRWGKGRGNWRMEWVASTLHTTSEHGVSSITTSDAAHLCCQQSTELTPTGRFKCTRPFRAKDEILFLRVCHHISTGLYFIHAANVKAVLFSLEQVFRTLKHACPKSHAEKFPWHFALTAVTGSSIPFFPTSVCIL